MATSIKVSFGSDAALVENDLKTAGSVGSS